jgi:hypothetical protein
VRKKGIGSSLASARRRAIASKLSQRLRDGDPEAAFRLKQRQRALKGIAMSGYQWRLELANEARRMKREAAKRTAAERQLEPEARQRTCSCGYLVGHPPIAWSAGPLRQAYNAQQRRDNFEPKQPVRDFWQSLWNPLRK